MRREAGAVAPAGFRVAIIQYNTIQYIIYIILYYIMYLFQSAVAPDGFRVAKGRSSSSLTRGGRQELGESSLRARLYYNII